MHDGDSARVAKTDVTLVYSDHCAITARLATRWNSILFVVAHGPYTGSGGVEGTDRFWDQLGGQVTQCCRRSGTLVLLTDANAQLRYHILEFINHAASFVQFR